MGAILAYKGINSRMFGKRKKQNQFGHKAQSEAQSLQMSLLETIAHKEKDDPLIRAKIASKSITTQILGMLNDEKGVRIETALGIVGSMAGFCTSYAMMHEVISGVLPINQPEVAIAKLTSGEEVMFGNYINRKLVEGELIGDQTLSLWAIAAGIAQQLGQMPKFDLAEIFSHVSKTIGHREFGSWRLAEQHHPGDKPQTYVKELFKDFLPVLKDYQLPENQYFLAFALSSQEIIALGKDALPPEIGCQIVMECAVPASKLDPRPYMKL